MKINAKFEKYNERNNDSQLYFFILLSVASCIR